MTLSYKKCSCLQNIILFVYARLSRIFIKKVVDATTDQHVLMRINVRQKADEWSSISKDNQPMSFKLLNSTKRVFQKIEGESKKINNSDLVKCKQSLL